jgi:hypothetical protein
MRARTGLYADQARRQPAEDLEDPASSQLAAQGDRSVNRDAVQLKHALGEIDADRGSLSYGWLLCAGTF